MAELKDILEALIFVHRGVLPVKTVEAVVKDEFTREEIKESFDSLKEDYERRGGVIQLLEVAEGYEFRTRSEVGEWIQKLDFYQHHRHLSRPALETLAIVAYRQPVTRPEIEEIRGVSVDRILRNLVEKKLIKVLGRKDVPGKPLVYGTGKDFLMHFGLASLSELPPLKEFISELPDEAGEGEEAEILPLEEEGSGSDDSPAENDESQGEEENLEPAPEEKDSRES